MDQNQSSFNAQHAQSEPHTNENLSRHKVCVCLYACMPACASVYITSQCDCKFMLLLVFTEELP